MGRVMKQSKSKFYGCLFGGAALGAFSVLYACGDDTAATPPVEELPDAAPAPQDSAPADVQAPVVDAAPPPPVDASVACTDASLFCDNFDQANRTLVVSADGWVMFDGEASDVKLSETVFHSAPRSAQISRPTSSGVTAQKTFENLTKSTLTIDLDYRIDVSGTTVSIIPPVLVEVLPHPDGLNTNSLLINHRGADAWFEYDNGNGTAADEPVVSPLNKWNHAQLVLSTGVDGGTVTGTASVNGATPVTLSLPSTTMTTVILRIGQIYGGPGIPWNKADVLIDNVVVNAQ